MTDWLLALVPTYGVWLLAATTFLSCLAIPIPSSVLMIAAGGFVAAGDLGLVATAGAAWGGALAGDQTGYWIARRAGQGLVDRLGSRAAPLTRARDLLIRRGGLAVFLTRWLLAPLGPYTNFAAGIAPLRWGTFVLCGALGSACWVALYVTLGYLLMGNLAAASGMAFKFLGAIGAGGIAVGLALWLRARLRADRVAEAGLGDGR
jgi:membrane protein DedA with SNARE-associated domain